MLSTLFVKNFAIIDDLVIDFNEGFNIITGESGAGKSIIIKALALLTGTRADKSFIKNNADSAIISISFTDIPDTVKNFLANNYLGEECFIRRVIDNKGKSKVFINDNLTTLNLLQQLTDLLIDIFSQNSHQLLLDNSIQRQILDDYAKNNKDLKTLGEVYNEINNLTKEIEHIKGNNLDAQNKLEFLNFQLQEFIDIKIDNDEIQTIENNYKSATNIKNLTENLTSVINHLSNIDNEINSADILLNNANSIDNKLNEAYNLLNSSKINLTECSYEISKYISQHDIDNSDELESRIGLLYDLARKHNCQIIDLANKQNSIKEEIDNLKNAANNLTKLEDKYHNLLNKYNSLSQNLSENRIKAAKGLGDRITKIMQKFAMPYAEFKININSDINKISKNGYDSIDFLINTGNDFKPLKKIASGGELSRINLAIAVMSSSSAYSSTLVFDEVDSGISGEVAKVVALELKKLSEKYQVLCITHLPQVAAKSDTHILIDNSNNSRVIKYLTKEQKLQAVATMISGQNPTNTTLNLAKEMIDD